MINNEFLISKIRESVLDRYKGKSFSRLTKVRRRNLYQEGYRFTPEQYHAVFKLIRYLLSESEERELIPRNDLIFILNKRRGNECDLDKSYFCVEMDDVIRECCYDSDNPVIQKLTMVSNRYRFTCEKNWSLIYNLISDCLPEENIKYYSISALKILCYRNTNDLSACRHF